jgi:hypothetical protein
MSVENRSNNEIPTEPKNYVQKKMSRAESVKNSRRYPKTKSGISQNRQPATILPSYLPLKKYMVRDISNVKPVRQQQSSYTKHKTSRTPFSQRTGVSTAKHGYRNGSKDTFEEFVNKVNSNNAQNNNRVRPYTSTGAGTGQVRIRTNKKPATKSGLADRFNPYLKSNRNFAYQNYNKKHGPKASSQVKHNNLLGYAEQSISKGRGTFYPNLSDSLINKTHMSAETSNNRKTHVGNITTYYDKSSK